MEYADYVAECDAEAEEVCGEMQGQFLNELENKTKEELIDVIFKNYFEREVLRFENIKAEHNINGIMDVIAIDLKNKRVKCRWDFDYSGYQEGIFEVNKKAFDNGSKKKVMLWSFDYGKKIEIRI